MLSMNQRVRIKGTKSSSNPRKQAAGRIIAINELGGRTVYDVRARVYKRGEVILSFLPETDLEVR